VTKPNSILFRCDASAEIGFGHLVRCLALADEIHRLSETRVGFALRDGTLGSELVARHGYEVFHMPKGASYNDWLGETMRLCNAKILVVDVRDDLSCRQLTEVRGEDRMIVLLDDISDRRFAADLAFYPPVPQVSRTDWDKFSGERLVGWEWIILRSQFAKSLPPRETSTRHSSTRSLSILIAMGGSDPAGLTVKAVRAVDRLHGDRLEADFESVIVLGSAFCHRESLQSFLASARRQFTVRDNVSEMRDAMEKTDLALCSFGMTAYELAATGVPAVYACLTKDHEESASALVAAGAGMSVGVDDQNTEARLSVAVEQLLRDASLRERMASRSRQLIDGKGAMRTAEAVLQRSEKL
jgi:spore coat polysaccharide biosynthesis protein SpsF